VDQLVVCIGGGGGGGGGGIPKFQIFFCGDWAITQKNHLGHSQNRIVNFPFGLPIMHLTRIFWAKDVGI
jgi:hypothetical protein